MNVPLWLFISCVVLAGLVGWWARARIAEHDKQRLVVKWTERNKPYWEHLSIVPYGFAKEPLRRVEQKVREVGE